MFELRHKSYSLKELIQHNPISEFPSQLYKIDLI